jgi:hypothetical protein
VRRRTLECEYENDVADLLVVDLSENEDVDDEPALLAATQASFCAVPVM